MFEPGLRTGDPVQTPRNKTRANFGGRQFSKEPCFMNQKTTARSASHIPARENQGPRSNGVAPSHNCPNKEYLSRECT